MKELITIQSELKAPKSQFNRFGNYKYRKAEDILEAVKPLLKKESCTLTITDEIIMIGNRIYVKATATLKNSKGDTESTQGWAREEDTKKGMDASQITGASSSYARKYALNGLFAIDDNADSDTTNVGDTHQPAANNAGTTTTASASTAAHQYHPDNLQEGLYMITQCNTKDLIVWLLRPSQPLCANPQFMQAVSAKKKELHIA